LRFQVEVDEIQQVTVLRLTIEKMLSQELSNHQRITTIIKPLLSQPL